MKISLKDKVKILRTMHSLTQMAMAEKLELSVPAYQQVENGDTKIISKNLDKILKEFDLNLLEFLSIGEKGLVCLINEYSLNNLSDNSHSTIIAGSNTVNESFKEIQRLEQIIELQQKRINDLENMVQLLKDRYKDKTS